MEHEEIREMVLLLRDGKLSASEESAVEAHLKDCPSCRQLHEDVCRIGPMLFGEPDPSFSEQFVSGVMNLVDHVGAEESQKDGIELPLRWWLPAFSFGLAGAILLATFPRPEASVSVESLFSERTGISTIESQDYRVTYLANLLAVPLEER